MCTNIMKNLKTASLGNAVSDGIRISVSNPALSAFDSFELCCFSRLF